MTQIVKVRKANNDSSMIITLPKSIANLLNIKIGTSLELSQKDTDRLEMRIIR